MLRVTPLLPGIILGIALVNHDLNATNIDLVTSALIDIEYILYGKTCYVTLKIH